MQSPIYVWKKAPCIRLLFSLAAGIWLQWQVQWPLLYLSSGFLCCFFAVLLYSLLPLEMKYKWAAFFGIFIHLLLATTGGILVYLKDIRNQPYWIGKNIPAKACVIISLAEPLVEKPNSFKAVATVNGFYTINSFQKARGRLLLYFKKDSSIKKLRYGSRILCLKPPHAISDNQNPGGFNFSRYCLFNSITHQLYLTGADYIILEKDKPPFIKNFIFSSRNHVVLLLRKFIQGRKEQGLAEALLIGYKDDLDKNLVQSYSNTGVIHIIAISGLHLGLIYAILLVLTKPLKKSGIIRLLLILSSLWLFSIMAGGQPSVLRSALMFSFIATAEIIKRQSNIFNTLAVSAFILLCINPFWLWDVGFQLSYSAVLSIVMFFRPVYNWFYFPNRMLEFIWKLMAVTLSAQLLTLPVSIYHFHQLPTLFLLSNIVAVPLSSIILTGEIVLCALFFLEPAAKFMGLLLGELITLMNSYIERLATIPFAVWNGLYISQAQTIFLFLIILGFCYWLLENKKFYLWTALHALLIFMFLRSLSFRQAIQQKQIIVYNIPRQRAIEYFNGRQAVFYGDTAVWLDPFLNSFHLQPSHQLHRIINTEIGQPQEMDLQFHNKRILMPGKGKYFSSGPSRIDLLIISRNTEPSFSQLIHSFTIGQVVLDASLPSWKTLAWKKHFDSTGIPCHTITQNGAFVMKL